MQETALMADAPNSTPTARLTAIRAPLIELHRTLLQSERRLYEIAHGRVTPGELLTLALKDQQFAWLHQLSAVIVRVDELVAGDAPLSEADVSSVVTELRALLTPSATGTWLEQRYDRAIQNDPAVLLAHRGVMSVLRP
jgi:hypothetical protein